MASEKTKCRSQWNSEKDGNDTYFVPIQAVKTYLQESESERLKGILEELYAIPCSSLPPPPEIVLNEYVAILCILVSIDQGATLHEFTRNNIRDVSLPLPVDPKQNPQHFPPDTGKFYKKFCREQWKFCAPEFSVNLDRNFDKNLILPIERMEQIGEGASAEIHMIEIHSAYNK